MFSRNSSRDTVKLGNSETDLRVPLFKTASEQKSFSYRSAHLWNRFNPEVKQAPSLYALNNDFDVFIYILFSFVIRLFTFIVII